MIRGHGVEEALNALHFTPKHAARTAEKALRSAISNFQNKDEAGRVDTAELFVKTAFVDGGPVLKRISPAPMGRAYRIRKRSNHITIVVARREGKKGASAQPRKAGAEDQTVQKPAVKRTKKAAGTKTKSKAVTKA
jgi:large subunit ribosomal protein L22